MKVLFVDMHREGRSPSQRFRYEQYLPHLTSNNITWEHSYLLNKEDDKPFYQSGNYWRKFLILLRSIKKRINDIRKANDVDVVFVQREAFMLGSTFFENQFAKSKATLIFDFDDAIWIGQESKSSSPNKHLAWLKNPLKTKRIIEISNTVIVGNEYLAEYARRFNDNVVIIPTTIDTDEYQPKEPNEYKKNVVCIGWSGSKTTIDHFEEALPYLKILKNKYRDKVVIKVIGNEMYHHEGLGINGVPWNKETELEDLKEIDIGIMPLPDDEWAKGKCGLKGLQYMALGIPTIMSPVGVNCEIIEDGVNGYLPKNENEWVEKISKLIENEDLRKSLGRKGREQVEKKYSVCSQKENFISLVAGKSISY